MTTGIQLIQPVPVRAAAQILGAQLSPKGARIDAPEPRRFDAALYEAGERTGLGTPSEHHGKPDEIDRPGEGEPSHNHGEADQTDNGGVGVDSGVTPENDEGAPIDPEPTRPDASDGPGDGSEHEDRKTQAGKGEGGVGTDAGAGPGQIDADHVMPDPEVGSPGGAQGANTGDQAGVFGPTPVEFGEPGAGPDAGGATPDVPRTPTIEVDATATPIDAKRDARAAHVSQTPAPPTDAQTRLRLDDAVRDEVKQPARIDLDELAAQRLSTPSRTIPGDLGEPGGSGVQRAAIAEQRLSDNGPASRWVIDADADELAPPRVDGAPIPPATNNSDGGRAVSGEARAQAAPGGVNPNGADTSHNSDGEGRPGGQSQPGASKDARVSAPSAPVVGDAPTFRVTPQSTPNIGDTKGVTKAGGIDASKLAPKPTAGARPDSGEAARRMMAQVSRGVASVLRQKGGSLTLRLTPQSLGELKIHLRLEGGGVNASFRAGSAEARELLSNNLDSLKATLEQHGVRVERLSVEDESGRARDASHARAEDPRTRGEEPPQRPMDSGEDGRSPGDQRHGGRSGDNAGGESRADQHDRRSAGGVAEGQGEAVLAGGASAPGGFLGLDTLA